MPSSFNLKMATAVFVETLENLQHLTGLILESQSYTFKSGRENMRTRRNHVCTPSSGRTTQKEIAEKRSSMAEQRRMGTFLFKHVTTLSLKLNTAFLCIAMTVNYYMPNGGKGSLEFNEE
jgi:hypothetical protein